MKFLFWNRHLMKKIDWNNEKTKAKCEVPFQFLYQIHKLSLIVERKYQTTTWPGQPLLGESRTDSELSVSGNSQEGSFSESQLTTTSSTDFTSGIKPLLALWLRFSRLEHALLRWVQDPLFMRCLIVLESYKCVYLCSVGTSEETPPDETSEDEDRTDRSDKSNQEQEAPRAGLLNSSDKSMNDPNPQRHPDHQFCRILSI